MTASEVRDPFSMLRELLKDDRRAGVPWSGADFAQRVHLVCRETGAPRSWRWSVIDTTPAWRDAYTGRRVGAVAGLHPTLMDDEGRRGGLDALIAEPAGV